MKTRILLIVILAFIGLSTQAQITFVKTYDDNNNSRGNAVQQTSDGGYIMTGYKQGNNISNIYLVKSNANGDTLWTKTYGSFNIHNVGYSVQQTYDGGYVVVGTIDDPSVGPVHVYLIKTNSIGDTLWTKSYGSTGNDYGYSVKQTLDSGFIIAGATNGLGAGGYDAFLIKTNSIGDTLWTKTYGGIHDEFAESVDITTDGGYIITGYSNSFGSGGNDVYLIKTDSIGDTLWTKTYGISGYDDYGYSVKQTSDGGYIIAGSLYYRGYMYLIKTTSIGDTLWTKTFGFGTAHSVQQTIDGGYIIAGTQVNGIEPWLTQVFFIKTNSIGETLWANVYDDGNLTGTGYSVQQTTDGGHIITGGMNGNMYLIKTDTNGNSGCFQHTPIIYLNSDSTKISNTATIVGSGCLVSNPSKPVGSGGTAVTILCFSTGINEIKTQPSLLLSPNPFTTFTTLTLQGTYHNPSLFIYNLMGQEVSSIPIGTNNQITIPRNQLPAGMYFYQLIDAAGSVATGKLVVED